MYAEHSLLRKRRNKNSLTPKPDLHCIPFSVHFLQKQSATRDYLSDSFGTGNAFLLVLFQSLHGRVPVIPEEHIRCLTLVNPECSTYCSQEIWADTTHHTTQLSCLLARWFHMTNWDCKHHASPFPRLQASQPTGEKVCHTSSGPQSLLPIYVPGWRIHRFSKCNSNTMFLKTFDNNFMSKNV